MAYESERTTPIPPLREVNFGTDTAVDNAATSHARAAGDEEPCQPVEVESAATRAGGSDLRPKIGALREVYIDRAPDVRKDIETLDANDKEKRAKESSAFIPIAVWTVIAIFVFWIACQLLPLVSSALCFSVRDWRFYVTFGLFLIPFSLLLFVSCRVYFLFRKLPPFPQEVLDPEEKEKSYVVRERLLNGYLEELPETVEYATAAGFDGGEKDEVVEVLNRLRGKGSRYSDEVGWLGDFRRLQEFQRSRANKIIWRYSKLIGLKTAASPWKLVDIICVFLNSTLMVADLAKLYNRRVDRSAAFRLVFRWFLNIYISGEAGEISTKVAGAIGEQLKEPVKDSLSNLGCLDSDWGGTVAKALPFMAEGVPFVAKLAGKAVEGGVNAYFAIRMGRKAVAAFEALVVSD